MLCRNAQWVRGGCAGFLPYFRAESCVVTFCAIFLPIFRADESCLLFRAGFWSYFRSELENVAACAGKSSQIRPGCLEVPFCAGIYTLFLFGSNTFTLSLFTQGCRIGKQCKIPFARISREHFLQKCCNLLCCNNICATPCSNSHIQ